MTELLTVAWMSRLPMDIIKHLGQSHGVDPFLIAAICMAESSGRQDATKFEAHYPYLHKEESWAEKFGCPLEDEKKGQMTSYGLMQVMGAVMREYGFAESFDKAFDPETNIEYGTRHLANFLKKYDTPSAIASYNAGSPRYAAGSTVFKNQKYVDQVLGYWTEARGISKKDVRSRH